LICVQERVWARFFFLSSDDVARGYTRQKASCLQDCNWIAHLPPAPFAVPLLSSVSSRREMEETSKGGHRDGFGPCHDPRALEDMGAREHVALETEGEDMSSVSRRMPDTHTASCLDAPARCFRQCNPPSDHPSIHRSIALSAENQIRSNLSAKSSRDAALV
jgi:hypothetical protein